MCGMKKPEAEITVVLAYSSAARTVCEICLSVPNGITLAEALVVWAARNPSNELAAQAAAGRFGIWGKAANPGQVLEANDRVELYRPLTVDPKTARRQRFVRQGTKGAGLFAAKRVGSKAGY